MDTETINDIRAIQAGIGALKYRPDLHDLERQSHEIRLCHIRDALPEMYAALRAQQERENGCEYCNDSDCPALFWQYGIDHIFPDIKFCPMCGRKLEPKGGEKG